MILSNFNRGYVKPIVIITLFAVLALTVTGCQDAAEDFGCENFNLTPPAATPEETVAEKAPPATTITTEDRAILAAHEHLFTLAEGYKAKLYLADFYTTCEEWSAESELLKDGTTVWYVVVHMTSMGALGENPHWQQACWLVSQGGKVIPSSRSDANALRIEADLQELSLQTVS